jgi:hypothetical protein
MSQGRAEAVEAVARFAGAKAVNRRADSADLLPILERVLGGELAPPRLGAWLVEVVCSERQSRGRRQRLAEHYTEIAAEFGHRLAITWFWAKVVSDIGAAIYAPLLKLRLLLAPADKS